MGNRSYRGRRKVVEKFTMRQGLWILTVLGAVAMGTVFLYMLGFLHLDG